MEISLTIPFILAVTFVLFVVVLLWLLWRKTIKEELMPESTEKYFEKQELERRLPNHNMNGNGGKG